MVTLIVDQIARELRLQPDQVRRAIELLDDDNTIPFIARYRKEATGGMDEVQVGNIQERVGYLRNLMQRKGDVIRVINELKGTVRNVVDFGAFVDIGVKQGMSEAFVTTNASLVLDSRPPVTHHCEARLPR
ncbi:MAG: hypothetical protein M1343_02885 [Chloroflexi bacterium]|nr:hypothetical protein [Chloroflexota bacterium]